MDRLAESVKDLDAAQAGAHFIEVETNISEIEAEIERLEAELKDLDEAEFEPIRKVVGKTSRVVTPEEQRAEAEAAINAQIRTQRDLLKASLATRTDLFEKAKSDLFAQRSLLQAEVKRLVAQGKETDALIKKREELADVEAEIERLRTGGTDDGGGGGGGKVPIWKRDLEELLEYLERAEKDIQRVSNAFPNLIPDAALQRIAEWNNVIAEAADKVDARMEESRDARMEEVFAEIEAMTARRDAAAEEARERLEWNERVVQSVASRLDFENKSLAENLNVIRSMILSEIQAYMAKAIAGALAHEFATKGLVGAITGGAAAAAATALFGRLIPKFATGVTDFRGGLAIVGERGPELISLPVGANVLTNENTRAVMAAMQGLRIAGPSVAAFGGASNAEVVRALGRVEKAISKMRPVVEVSTMQAALEQQAILDGLAGNT